MTRESNAYLLNTHVSNQMDKGYKLLVRKKPTDIDSVKDCRILTVLTGMAYNSIYVVGCGLGDILVNLKRLKPQSTVSGCETSDIFRSFGNTHFKVASAGVNFEIKEPPYHTLPEADIMVSLNYLNEDGQSIETFKNMLSSGRTVVLFDSYPVRKFIETNCGVELVFTEHEDYTAYSKAETTEEEKPVFYDVFSSHQFAGSGSI